MSDPVYFELSWSILSSICIFCLVVVAVVFINFGWSRLLLVPTVVSTSGAIANGLCYYAYYAVNTYPEYNRTIAGCFADIFWMIQEIGLSFYSFQILMASGQAKTVKYYIPFFAFVASGCILRFAIMYSRIQQSLGIVDPDVIQFRISHLHIGYFLSIAMAEIVNAVFLMSTYRKLRFSESIIKVSFIRSSELRLASLSLIGIARTITYSFQTMPQQASNIASQIDRYVYSLECIYPIILLVDWLICKSVVGVFSVHSKLKPEKKELEKKGSKTLL